MVRGLLNFGGVVATGAGLHTLLAGGKSFPPWRPASPMFEGELRFYSAFYVAYGQLLLRTARREDLGRAAAWRTVGKPHPFQRALLAVELALPPLVMVDPRRKRVEDGQSWHGLRFPRAPIRRPTS